MHPYIVHSSQPAPHVPDPPPVTTTLPKSVATPTAVPTYTMPPPAVQPLPPYKVQPLQPWSVGLCGCSWEYYKRLCISCWCPFITFGQISEIIDGGTSSCATNGAMYFGLQWLTGCAWIYSCMYRSRMRRLYMLQGNDCTDCLLHGCCCEARSLTQMYRELEHRGFDVALGWQRNLERQQMNGVTVGLAMVAPAVGGGMMR